MVIQYNPLLNDTSLKRTPRVGHCFSLLFLVDSLKDGLIVPLLKVSVYSYSQSTVVLMH